MKIIEVHFRVGSVSDFLDYIDKMAFGTRFYSSGGASFTLRFTDPENYEAFVRGEDNLPENFMGCSPSRLLALILKERILAENNEGLSSVSLSCKPYDVIYQPEFKKPR